MGECMSSRVPQSVAAVLTAVPGLLGFVPHRSLVILAFTEDGERVVATMRHDFARRADGSAHEHMYATLRDLAAITASYGVTTVAAVIVDDRLRRGDAAHREFAHRMHDILAGCGGLHAGYVVETMTEGQRWCTVWGEEARDGADSDEVLGDPFTSPTATRAAVEQGRTVVASRDRVGADLSPDGCACGGYGFDAHGHTETDPVAAVATVMGALDGPVDCVTAAAVGRALCDLDIRDALLALAGTTAHRHTAANLWQHIARHSIGTVRASAATMLAHLYYVAGEGAMSGIALDEALAADSDWALARLLDEALRAGAHPSVLRSILETSADMLALLGVPVEVDAVAALPA